MLSFKADIRMASAGSKMSVAQLVGFLLQGSASNWWGLGCPAHCAGSLSILFLALVAGVCLGFILALWIFQASLFLPSARRPDLPAESPAASEASRPRSLRLRGYLHE